ncbi:MAG: indole-3-glycerol phosphate synthase TrpC [Actinomycetota bacterium]
MGFLSDLVSRRRAELEERPLDDESLRVAAASAPPAKDFEAALRGPGVALIAEVKRSSPSAGAIAETEPEERARTYTRGGAAAISVLTETEHFSGSMDDLRAARAATDLPLLRKDFLIAPAQLAEARAAGADAVLVIAAAVTDDELAALLQTAKELELSALVEAHGEDDLERALTAGAPIVGINARDLETLDVDEDRALRLLEGVPRDRARVFESGIAMRAQVQRAVDAGADAVLVGEHLMRSADPAAAIAELRGTRS